MMKSLAFYSAVTVVAAAVVVYVLTRNSAALATQPSPAEAAGTPSLKVATETKTKATPRLRVYNTGDWEDWPATNFPVVYRIEVPEVPEEITCPSPPIPPDAE